LLTPDPVFFALKAREIKKRQINMVSVGRALKMVSSLGRLGQLEGAKHTMCAWETSSSL
jgi:hypothetical protein